MKTFHLANPNTHPDKKLNPFPQVVQLNTKGRSKNKLMAVARLTIHHSKISPGGRLAPFAAWLFAWGRTHRSLARERQTALPPCTLFHVISIQLSWGYGIFLLMLHIHSLQ